MLHILRCVWCILFCVLFTNIAYGNERYRLEEIFNNLLPLTYKLSYLQSLQDNDIFFSSKEEINLVSEIIENRSLHLVGFDRIDGLDEILPHIFEILLKMDLQTLEASSRSRLLVALISIDPNKHGNFFMAYQLRSLYSQVLDKLLAALSGKSTTSSSNSMIIKVQPNIPENISTSDKWQQLEIQKSTFETLSFLIDPLTYTSNISNQKENIKNKKLELQKYFFSDTKKNAQNYLMYIIFSSSLSKEEKIEILNKFITTYFSFSKTDLEIIKKVLDVNTVDLEIKAKISEIVLLKNDYQDLLSIFTSYDIKSFIFLSFNLKNNPDKKLDINNLNTFSNKNSLYNMIDPQDFFNREEEFIGQYVRFDLWDQLLKYIEDPNEKDSIKKLAIKTCLNLLPKTTNFELFNYKFLKTLKGITDNPKESQELKKIAQHISQYIQNVERTSLKDCYCALKFIF